MSSSGDAVSDAPSDLETDFTKAAGDTGAEPKTLSKRPKSFMRFVILAVTTLCITQILANQSSYNFTKQCEKNDSLSFHYSNEEKKIIKSATAFGSFAATIPMMLAMDRMPKKFILLGCGVLTSIATALTPFMESQGFYYFMFARIFQGIAFCVTFPIAGSVTSEWASLKEHGIFLAFLTGFSQLSSIYLYVVAAVICDQTGNWRIVYYAMGGAGIIFLTLFWFFFTDKPEDNSRVTEEELAWILKDKPEKSLVRDPIPYKKMLKSKVIWAVWTSAFSDILAIQFIIMYNAQYFNTYLNMSILKTGIYGAVPFLVQWFCKIFAGISSDYITRLSETLKLKVYNSIALGASGIFFCILSFVPPSDPKGCFAVLVITEGLIGFNTAGFNKCGTLHARQHSHFVMIMKVNIQSLCILIEPHIADSIITDNTPLQWGIVFWIHGVLLVAAAIHFIFWARAEAAPWTEPPATEEVSEEDMEKNVKSQAESPENAIEICSLDGCQSTLSNRLCCRRIEGKDSTASTEQTKRP